MKNHICELGYCPYAEPYAAQAYDLVCDDCPYWIAVDDEEGFRAEYMMNEYIKKNVVVEEINRRVEEYIAQGQNARAKTLASFGRFVREMTVADVSEQKHGGWKRAFSEDKNVYECSECGKTWLLNAGTPFDNEMDFCPKCGAYMCNTK